jgi:cyclin B
MSTRPSSSANNARRAFGRDLTNVTNPDAGGKGGNTKASRGSLAADAQQLTSTSSIPALPLASRGSDSGVEGRPSSARTSSATAYNRREADDIDARDSNNPLMVTDYVKDIYDNMRHKEADAVSATYMQRQPHINEKMRAILIDWLVEVHQKFRCVPETLYLTINLIDRYLELEQVERSKLQLVGVTALLLAAKYEEIYPPELRDLVYITDKAYTKEEILTMESKILKALKYQVTIASTHSFLVRYLKAAHADRRMVWLACYITERALQEYSMLQHRPSVVASSAVYLARKNVQRTPWSPTLYKYTQYAENTLRPCLQEMSSILNAKTSLTAVKKKYSSQKFGGVASMTLEGI